MIHIEEYMADLIGRLRLEFADRLVYVGLQGSFRRGEADENSDIDVMVTLDRLTVEDLDRYREVVSGMPHADQSCGFISGREELKNWPPFELCQLLHETKDYYGELKPLAPSFDRRDVARYVGISVGNLYHILCHSRIHSDRARYADTLRGLYKGVFYILQNSHYLQSGEWVMTKAELLPLLSGLDREVLGMAMTVKSAPEYDWEKAYDILFAWCRDFFSTSLELRYPEPPQSAGWEVS